MNDGHLVGAVARRDGDSHGAAASRTTLTQQVPQQRRHDPSPASDGATPAAAPPAAAAARTTALEFQLDRETGRLVVAVVDRMNGTVVRAFPLVLPGFGPDDPRRGALVDAKV